MEYIHTTKIPKPWKDRIIVQPVEEEKKTVMGIAIPDSANKKAPQEGIIIGIKNRNDLKKGDRIIFSKYSGTDMALFSDKGKQTMEIKIITEDDILGIYE